MKLSVIFKYKCEREVDGGNEPRTWEVHSNETDWENPTRYKNIGCFPPRFNNIMYSFFKTVFRMQYCICIQT